MDTYELSKGPSHLLLPPPLYLPPRLLKHHLLPHALPRLINRVDDVLVDAVVYGADVVDLPHLILLPVIDGLNDLVQVAPELRAVLVVVPSDEKALVLERQLGQVRGGGMLVECTLSLRLPHPQILRPTPTNLLPRPQTILFEVIIKILFGPKMLDFVVMRLTEVVKVLFFVINRVKTLHELTPDAHNPAAAATMPIRLVPPHPLILW